MPRSFSCACVTTLESILSENEFNLFWNKVKQFIKKHKFDEPHLTRRKKILNRCMIGKAAGEHPENVEEEHRRQYFPALDSVIACIKEQFAFSLYSLECFTERRY